MCRSTCPSKPQLSVFLPPFTPCFSPCLSFPSLPIFFPSFLPTPFFFSLFQFILQIIASTCKTESSGMYTQAIDYFAIDSCRSIAFGYLKMKEIATGQTGS